MLCDEPWGLAYYIQFSLCVFLQMAQAISCNYSRTALRALYQRERGVGKKRSCGAIPKVVEEYNKHFAEQGDDMHLSLDIAYKRIPQLLATFNIKWHPQSLLQTFLSVFSLEAWTSLPPSEKNQHTLRDCSACASKHTSLNRAFPSKRKVSESLPEISFSGQDLSSPSSFGKRALDAICEDKFKMSIQSVLSKTPSSKLVVKPSSQEKQSEMRRVVRSVKKTIQQSMDETSVSTVISNRVSWRKFDHIRKSSTLENKAKLQQENVVTPLMRIHLLQKESMVHQLTLLSWMIFFQKLKLGVLIKL